MKKIITIALGLLLLMGCGGNKKTAKDINEMEYIDAVKYLADDFLDGSGIKNVEVSKSFYDGDCILIQYLTSETVSDETDFVNRGFTHYVDICRQAYTHKDAIPIYFNVDSELIDSKGNIETRTLIYLLMDIDKFNTYKWDNLMFRPLDFNAVSNDCKIFMLKKPTITTFDPSGFMYKTVEY